MNLLSACVLSTCDLVDRRQGSGLYVASFFRILMEFNGATVLKLSISPCLTLLHHQNSKYTGCSEQLPIPYHSSPTCFGHSWDMRG